MQEYSKGGWARNCSIFPDLRQLLAVERVAYSRASLAELCGEDEAIRMPHALLVRDVERLDTCVVRTMPFRRLADWALPMTFNPNQRHLVRYYTCTGWCCERSARLQATAAASIASPRAL